jgi:hypothetical protein
MSELVFATRHFDPSVRAGAAPIAAVPEVASMREKLEALRDVVISLGLQLVFRATILLRRWNY